MLPEGKAILAINQASATNAATATGNIDTMGFDYAIIDVLATTSNAVSNNPSVLKIAESDDTVVTNFADITELVGDGAGGFTVPDAITAATSITGPFVRFGLNLQKRKRYLKVSISPLTTQSFSVLAHLMRGEIGVDSAADANATALVHL